MGCNGLSIPNNRHTALYGLSESDRSHCDKNIKEKKQAEKKRKNLSCYKCFLCDLSVTSPARSVCPKHKKLCALLQSVNTIINC